MKNGVLAFFIAVSALTACFAENVYLSACFEESSDIYRIKTTNEQRDPVGLCFTTKSSYVGCFIDVVKNYRFIRENTSEDIEFKPRSEPILRQVYDGDIRLADMGRAGNRTAFDSRDSLVQGESGKAIYRSLNVVFSAGLGKMWSGKDISLELAPGECDVVDNKKWYEIPNGSWYQTWRQSKGSYDIFYDLWENGFRAYFEDVWRNEPVYKAFDRKVASVSVKRLMRAKIDGSLELVDDGELKEVLGQTFKSSFFMLPPQNNRENIIGCYTWNGDQKGTFQFSNELKDIKPVYESSSSRNRYVCYGTAITGLRKYYVLGTDILRHWLSESGLLSNKAECTNVVSINLEKTLKCMIFVYSEPENCIYRFVISEENQIEIGLPKKIALDFKVDAMGLSHNGTLYLVPEVELKGRPDLDNLGNISMETCKVLKNSAGEPELEQEHFESEETHRNKIYSIKKIFCDADCELILSRPYYQEFYELPFGAEKAKKLDYKIFLGKEFYSCKVSYKNITLSKLDADLYTLLEEAKKKGNLIGEITHVVPDYENTLRKPKKYFLASHQ